MPILVRIRRPKSTRWLGKELWVSLISSARASHVQTRKEKGISDPLEEQYYHLIENGWGLTTTHILQKNVDEEETLGKRTDVRGNRFVRKTHTWGWSTGLVYN